ncbi:hypothetical protein U1Q18_001995 [Sarracenia purpurea var. burkii]
MARESGREKTPGRDGRSIQVKEKSKGIFDLGESDGVRCVVDGETSYGGSPRPEAAVMVAKSYVKGVTHEHSRQDAGVVSTIQEPREHGEPPTVVEHGSNPGKIDADYAKDNM